MFSFNRAFAPLLYAVLLAVFILASPAPARAQTICPDAMDGQCNVPADSGYTFGAAKAHDHGDPYFYQTIDCYYDGYGLANDPTNNGGNFFEGNTVYCTDMNGPHAFWYDWSADFNAGRKHQVWKGNYYQYLEVTYDPVCGLAFSVRNPFSSDGV